MIKHKKDEGIKVNTTKVRGKDSKHKVLVYALSTCAWCKKVKSFLKDHEIEYEYVDVDLCSEKEKEEIRRDILNRGGELAYPIIIIDDEILIHGFRGDEIKEALGI